MARLNPAERELLAQLDAMTPAQYRRWLRTPRPFDSQVNTAAVALASTHAKGC